MKILIALALFGSLLVAQTNGDKLWVMHQFAPSTDGSPGAEIFFIQDKETGTRCYAFRSMYHDGAAISCVPQK